MPSPNFSGEFNQETSHVEEVSLPLPYLPEDLCTIPLLENDLPDIALKDLEECKVTHDLPARFPHWKWGEVYAKMVDEEDKKLKDYLFDFIKELPEAPPMIMNLCNDIDLPEQDSL